MLEKLNWFSLSGLITLLLLMWKRMGLFLQENDLLRCWGFLSVLNWIGALTLFLLLKLPPRKLEPWFILWSFFSKVALYLYKSTYGYAWNTVVMSGLALLADTWNCLISYINGYAGLLVLHLLPLGLLAHWWNDVGITLVDVCLN